MGGVEPIAAGNATRHHGAMRSSARRFARSFSPFAASFVGASFAFVSGCAGTTGSSSAPEIPAASEQGASEPGASPSSSQSSPPSQSEGTVVPDARELLADDREPQPERALPGLEFTHLGMHIGGESNSPESKQPWLRAIEAGEIPILQCYRLVDKPMKGGSYGVDLYVGRKGGAPEVRGSRQKLGGKAFDECMRKAFLKLNFTRPERPTVLSYSLLFRLKEG